MTIEEMIKAGIAYRPRKFITPEIIHSVLVQESDLCSTFEKTDKQYRANVSVAMKLTGKTEAEIVGWATLSNGKIGKFRMEPSVFLTLKNKTMEEKFYLASSWGLAQKLGYLLMGKSSNVKSTILGFAANEPFQVVYCCGDMEAGMQRAYLSPSVKKKDLKSLAFFAYCAYNGGPSKMITKDPQVLKRAQEVIGRLS